jgi:NTP pyrophosphatase (non-canonical NTP hydrolase)
MFKTYIKETRRTRATLLSMLDNQLHMVMGISTEAGELLDAYKKRLAYNKQLDTVNIEEELGDLMWYVAGLIDMLGLDMEKILTKNIAKLQARYPEDFDEDKANNRDLEKEREILET